MLNIRFAKLDDSLGIETEYYKNGIEFLGTEKDLEMLAVCANSPWSQTDETYEIRYNCKDSYTKKLDNDPNFICTYTVVGYEAITSEIYRYGSTPKEALDSCISLFEQLQKEYNKDDKSF